MCELSKLKKIAFDCRLTVLDMVKEAKAGHIGGSMSCMDILVALYHSQLNPGERFILSKGHCAEALYAVLASKGVFQKELLKTFATFDTALAEHPTKKVPGVEFATGALGHGLSVGVGMAMGLEARVYVLMGDGELAEGSIWEAAMSAAKYRLKHLTAIVDRNRLQISGGTEDVMPLDDLGEKFRSFGWEVRICNGHEPGEILQAMAIGDKPLAVIANTVKGFGSAVMENNPEWHHHIPDEEQYLQIKTDFTQRRDSFG